MFTAGNPHGRRFEKGNAGGPGRPVGFGRKGNLSQMERERRNRTPIAEDAEAQALVDAHPDGMTLQQVAEYLGLTRERVRQIEAEALEKLNGCRPLIRMRRSAKRARELAAFSL